MASYTLTTLRQKVCEELGIWKSFTTTSAGSAAKLTVISTELSDLESESLTDKYIKVTSGATLETRRIKAFDSNLGTITVYRAFTAQIATSVTFEIHEVDPSEFTTYINAALRDSYPDLFTEVHDRSLVSGNILPSFQNWTASTYPDFWRVSAVTATESTSPLHFGSCVQLGTAAGYLYLSNSNYAELRNLENSTKTFSCWVKTAAASNARICLYTKTQGGTELTTYSDYHTGGGEWELLEIENYVVPDDLGTIEARCYIATTTAAYFDLPVIDAGWYEMPLPDTIDSVLYVYEGNDCDEVGVDDLIPQDFITEVKSGVKYIRILPSNSGPSSHNHLEIIGKGTFTALSAEAGTAFLEPTWVKVIIYGAAAGYLRSKASNIGTADMTNLDNRIKYYDGKFEQYKKSNRRVVHPPKIGRVLI